MQPVPEMTGAPVITNPGAGGELQVDPIPVTGQIVVFDREVPRVPSVDRVAGQPLNRASTPDGVTRYTAACGFAR